MTPKEKAEELVDKYFKLLNYEFGDEVYSLRDKQPHKCALIAVNAILNTIEVPSDRYIYWQEVKIILEKSNHNDLYGKDKSKD